MSTPDRPSRRFPLRSRRLQLTTVLAVASILVALLAWRFPVVPRADDSSDQSGQTSEQTTGGGATGQPTTPGGASPAATEVRYLNTVRPEEGVRYIAPLPDGLAQSSGYAHALTIGCPSNQTGDKVRELTYSLDQRYQTFAGTVEARFAPPAAEKDPEVELTSIADQRQRDGTLRTTGQESRRATTGAPAPISLTVTGAEKLTVRISCEEADGVVILTEARLTRAA